MGYHPISTPLIVYLSGSLCEEFQDSTWKLFIAAGAFLIRKTGVVVSLNWFAMVFGYVILSKIEAILQWKSSLSKVWVFSLMGEISFGSSAGLKFVGICFAGYVIALGFITALVLRKVDVS